MSDWSSDVCSSDLPASRSAGSGSRGRPGRGTPGGGSAPGRARSAGTASRWIYPQSGRMREQFGHREDALEPGQVDAGLDRRAQQLVAVVGLRRAGAADVAEADTESLCAYRVAAPRIAGIGADRKSGGKGKGAS